MSLLDQDAYGDTDDFMEQYGSDQPSLEQIRALQVGTATMTLSQTAMPFWRCRIHIIIVLLGWLCAAHSSDLQMDACRCVVVRYSWKNSAGCSLAAAVTAFACVRCTGCAGAGATAPHEGGCGGSA